MNQQQVKEGIDAVIVDSVLKIRNGLTKNAAQTPSEPATPWLLDNLANGVSAVNGIGTTNGAIVT